jgi:hypothetical protein
MHIHDHVPEFMGEIEALPFAVDATTDTSGCGSWPHETGRCLAAPGIAAIHAQA